MAHTLLDQILAQLETTSDRERQENQELRLNMYLDDYSDEINRILKTQFHKDNYRRLYPLLANYYNLFKKIVNLKSVLYKREAQRKWLKRNEKQDENYDEVIKKSNIDIVMPTCNKLTNINNTSFNRIMADIKEKVIRYEAIPSENISVIQDFENPSKFNALLHRVTIKDSNQSIKQTAGIFTPRTTDRFIIKYFYWDLENYIILDGHKKVSEELENPYKDKNGKGIIPYVLFTSFPGIAGSLWNETINSDLYSGTLQVNVFQTYFNNLIKIAGYRQPWLTGVGEKELKNLNEKVSDPLQPIVLSSSDSNIGTFELQSRIKDVGDAIHDIISEIADNHGVEFSSRVSSAQKMSGTALKLSKDAIDNIREEQQPLYRESENEQAEKTIIIANQDLKSNIDIEGEFRINFHEEKQVMDVKEKIEWNKFAIGLNVKSVVDLYKELDPDATNDEKVLERIEENKQQNDIIREDIPIMVQDNEQKV